MRRSECNRYANRLARSFMGLEAECRYAAPRLAPPVNRCTQLRVKDLASEGYVPVEVLPGLISSKV
jgi:hypothetical protein